MKWKCAVCGKKFTLSKSQLNNHRFRRARTFMCSKKCLKERRNKTHFWYIGKAVRK